MEKKKEERALSVLMRYLHICTACRRRAVTGSCNFKSVTTGGRQMQSPAAGVETCGKAA